MKISQTYIKRLLEAFESADSPITDILQLQDQGIDYKEDEFLFHLQLLADQQLVKQENGVGLGYSRGAGGDLSWSVVPLRLTAQGHDFLEALRNSDVWDAIKSEFQDASIGTLVRVSKELMGGYLKDQITKRLQ